MIVMKLRGRLGNQLFIYAFGRALQETYGDELILLDNVNDTGGSMLHKFNIPDHIHIISYESGNKYEYYQMRAEDYSKIKNKLVASFRKERNVRRICKQNHVPVMSFPQLIQYIIYRLQIRGKAYRQIYELEQKKKTSWERQGLIFCENGYLDFHNIKGKNKFCIGYFQSEAYFKHISDKIRREITPRHDLRPELQAFIHSIQSSDSVCLSIRMGDYMNNPVHGVCTLSYYRKAIDKIYQLKPNAKIFVFSDSPKDVIEHFKFQNPVVMEPDGCNELEKLTYMSICKHFILSNSSFSWWAQYLSDYKDKIIIAPDKWFAVDVPCNIYQPEWLLLHVEE